MQGGRVTANKLVIVESPAKAKTIGKYLGGAYTVLASYGHVRDLPARDGSVRPDEDFAMDWELGDRAKKHVDEIVRAARTSEQVILATDPDREGEAISWHVQEMLRSKRGTAKADFQRVTFNEITQSAVRHAMENPREVNRELVEAYLARRALDYLVGFTLSPVLWRKLPGSRSAGRVQSVALRLICEREAEIEDFRPREYWTLQVVFTTDAGTFAARLTHLDGKKLDKFAIADRDQAEAIVQRLAELSYQVAAVERRQVRRNPYPPFTTSTLQQEAARKLGNGATKTMRVAQRLYEGVDIGGETVGLITYMRTDGTQLSQEAVAAMRDRIASDFGPTYVPEQPRVYRSKAKNAQEAHEAIRPTDVGRTPASLRATLNTDELRLYELIWKRTVACQMASAVLDQVAVDIDGGNGTATLRATGSVVRFDGFLKVYDEDRDDPADGDEPHGGRRLPVLSEGQALTPAAPPLPDEAANPKAEQHFTQPPPRYSEASLVKSLEELGIGRPSTYASILQVLQDREYVRLEKRRFLPEDRGRLVTAFLTNFFRRYVEYDFTAKLEDQLDDISGGRIDWKSVLREFWTAFSSAVDETRGLSISQVIDALDREVGPHFFPERTDGRDPRACPACQSGRLGLRFSRGGAFIGCSNYPDCRFTRPLEVPSEDAAATETAFPRELGTDPQTQLPVTLRKGPFGHYVQLGPQPGETNAAEKPRRVSLPKSESPLELGLERALALLSLPRLVTEHPETKKPIHAGIGRYGPYLQHDGAYCSVPDDEDILAIGGNRAIELLAQGARRRGGSSEPLKSLGDHPTRKQPVAVFKGRYGPYVRLGKTKIMASLPKSETVEDVTLERAIELLEAKAAKAGGKAAGTKSSSAKTAAAKKAKGNGASAGNKAKTKAKAKPKGTGKATAKRQSASASAREEGK